MQAVGDRDPGWLAGGPVNQLRSLQHHQHPQRLASRPASSRSPTTASLFSEHHTPRAPADLLRGFRPEPLRPAEQHWPQWAAKLRQGFSLLFHGLGSKRAALNHFLHEHLVPRLGWEALVINGFQADATLPAILAELEAIILDHPSPASSNDEDQPHHHAPRKASSLEALEAQAQCLCGLLSRRRQHDQPDIVLLLHNLDGHGFRSPKIQTILGLLVAQPSLHLLATLDHIHAPVLRPLHRASARPGGQAPLASAFNFLYHQLPTPTGYVLESLLGTTFDALLPPSILLPSGLLLPTRIAAGLAPPAASFPTVGATGPAAVHVNLGQAGFVFIEANVKKWGLAPMAGTLAPPPAYGHQIGSILLASDTHARRNLMPSPSHSHYDPLQPSSEHVDDHRTDRSSVETATPPSTPPALPCPRTLFNNSSPTQAHAGNLLFQSSAVCPEALMAASGPTSVHDRLKTTPQLAVRHQRLR
ncbi:hypothetical protein PTTG_25505 [Puccinia triticina 1-1 BBBD Race 1]|uniref:Origin recognition complex subunit 2 n=1 Tax=Puccinia triticina (isolate 1-1 / race 1 (BBBD)) TaxID=630390 RepID=A0A180H184_PUCT1|nr:hypothetical protein PTTG_25505 [Puccinia triticina 1-1 BBBD Race 1]